MKCKSIKGASIVVITILVFIFVLSCLESCSSFSNTYTNAGATAETPSSNSAIFLIVGAIAVGSFIVYYVVRHRKKEQQIKTLLTKALNTAKTFYNPPLPTETYLIYQNNLGESAGSCPLVYDSIETPESSVEELVASKEVIEDIHKINLSQINFGILFKIVRRLNKAFPSLKQKFPEIGSLNFLMGLKSLPDEKILVFISNLLEKVSVKEIHTQISVEMNELMNSRDHENWKLVLHKIARLIYLGKSMGDRKLLKDLLLVLIFIKYSPEIN